MRYMGLDLNLMVVFKAMMDHRSVTEASRRLHLTQPAVSNALQRLREYFGDDLFVLSGNRMMPTAVAERLAVPIKSILQDTGAMITAVRPFDPATSDRTFVIGGTDHVTDTVIGPALNRIFEAAPGIRIDVVPLVDDQWSALQGGDVDLHILPAEFGAPNQPTFPLYSDRYAVLCDIDNHKVRPGMSPAELREFRIVGALMALQRKMRGGFSPQMEARLIDLASVTAKQFSQLPKLVENSDRIAIVPRMQAEQFCASGRLAFHDLPPGSPMLTMVLQIDKARENDAGLRWIVGELTASVATA